MAALLDYPLNRLFYDLHTKPALADEYRRDRAPVMARYRLTPDVVAALQRDDVAALAPLTNGFMMRYYFLAAGLSDAAFMAQLHAMKAPGAEVAHG